METNKQPQGWERVAGLADAGQRLDQYWAGELRDEGVSRGRVKDWIAAGFAAVDGKPCIKPNRKLAGGERLLLAPEPEAAADDAPRPEPGELTVLHEDADVAVIDKPAGLTTHPAPGLVEGTLVHRLLARFPDLAGEVSGMDAQRPGIVHRLDKDTSGLMVVARTEGARLALAADFAGREVGKVYLAVVHGRPQKAEGEIDAPIGRHPTSKVKMAVVPKGGRDARSAYRVLWTAPSGRASLVLVRIFTGRTHQIRVHMAHIGHPLVGDETYAPKRTAVWRERGDRAAGLAARQMLHAFRLSFTHPGSGERMTFVQPPPEDFLALLDALGESRLRVGLVGMPGSGKSAVLAALERRGLPVFSADRVVAELYAPGGDGAAMLRRHFALRFMTDPDDPDHSGVDKKKLMDAMRESEPLRREVMDLVHPMVEHAVREFWAAHADEPLAFAEVPLLLEGGWPGRGLVDVTACIVCPEERRTGEFRERRGLDRETLATFDSWQWSLDRKLAACRFVVRNDGDFQALDGEVDRLLRELHECARAAAGAHTARIAGWWAELAETFAAEDAAWTAARDAAAEVEAGDAGDGWEEDEHRDGGGDGM